MCSKGKLLTLSMYSSRYLSRCFGGLKLLLYFTRDLSFSSEFLKNSASLNFLKNSAKSLLISDKFDFSGVGVNLSPFLRSDISWFESFLFEKLFIFISWFLLTFAFVKDSLMIVRDVLKKISLVFEIGLFLNLIESCLFVIRYWYCHYIGVWMDYYV